MQVRVALYGAARVVTGQSLVEVSFDLPTVTLGQVLERMIADYPRVRPYLLDEDGMLPSFMRVLINNVRPDLQDLVVDAQWIGRCGAGDIIFWV